MHDVVAVRDVTVGWRLMSLRMLNETKPDYDPNKAKGHAFGLGAQRVAAAFRERGGDVFELKRGRDREPEVA